MQKEITIYDIAKELNLSAATISRGLKGDKVVSLTTMKRIADKAAEMGYRHNKFASSLRQRNTQTIGVLVHTLKSNFITSVLAGMEEVTTEAGYDIIIAHSSENYEREVANALNLFHKRVDGVAASLSFTTKNLDHFKCFFEKGIPVIFFDRAEEKSDHTHVIIDNYKCGYKATHHLIEQGCKKIVLFSADLTRNVYSERHRGYKDALAEAGIAYDEKLVIIKDLSEQSAIETAKEILRMNPVPDGIFCTNDFIGAVCMQELISQGKKVPEEIAIVGFNNDPIGKIVKPQLTTIDYPGNIMGEVTARSLINHLKGFGKLSETNRIIVKSELVVRGSSLRKK